MKTSISIRDTAMSPFIAAGGFYGVDFGFDVYDKRREILAADYEEKILKSYNQITESGLVVSQVHLTYYPGHLQPIGNGTYKAFEEQMLPILIKELEITAKMNCKRAVIHLYFENDIDNSRRGNISLITKLLPYLKKHEITLCIEDIYGPDYSPVHLSTAEELLFYTDHFGAKNVGICLDTGHAIILGQDPVDLAAALGDRIKALHIHSTYGKLDRHMLPFSEGDTVNWHKLYNVLVESRYSGTFNLETGCASDITDEQKREYYKSAYQIALKIIN